MIINIRREDQPAPKTVRMGDLPPGTIFQRGGDYYVIRAHSQYAHVTTRVRKCAVPVARLRGWKVNGFDAGVEVPETDIVPNATLTGEHG